MSIAAFSTVILFRSQLLFCFAVFSATCPGHFFLVAFLFLVLAATSVSSVSRFHLSPAPCPFSLSSLSPGALVLWVLLSFPSLLPVHFYPFFSFLFFLFGVFLCGVSFGVPWCFLVLPCGSPCCSWCSLLLSCLVVRDFCCSFFPSSLFSLVLVVLVVVLLPLTLS